GVATAPRRAAFGRPHQAVTSSSGRVWMNHWIGAWTNPSRRPHISLDSPTCGVICYAMAVSPLLAGSFSGGFGHPRGDTAFSLFPHFLVIPRLRRPLGMSYERMACAIKHDVDTDLGFTFSVGLAPNKGLVKSPQSEKTFGAGHPAASGCEAYLAKI